MMPMKELLTGVNREPDANSHTAVALQVLM